MMRRPFLKLIRRRRLQRDLDAELEFHQEMSTAGRNPVGLGNRSLVKEQAFDLWRFNAVENLWQDVVYSVRTLRKSPGFVIAALLSLSLGIGVNAAMFSLAVEFLFSEPSVRDVKSLVYVRQGGNSHMLPATLAQIRRSGLFEDVAGENEETFINFNNGTETRRVFAIQATKNYFTVLGVPLAQGRGWRETDGNEVAVLHPHFWRTRLGGDPSIVGKSLRLDGRLFTVLGILPDNYRSLIGYGYSPDILVPQYVEGTILAAYGRVKPGMTSRQLSAALPAVGKQLDREFPEQRDLNGRLNANPVSGVARLEKQGQGLAITLFFAVLLATVSLVLLIACVNVSGLLLARASARRQEIAIRLALGASRPRLLQQLLAESVLLSFTGAALGFAFAFSVAKVVAAIPLPFPVPIRLHIEPDWRVVCYAAALAVLAVFASGLMPAWQSLRESLAAGMHREHRTRVRRVLVAGQIAVSFVVLTAAVLFVQNLIRSSSLGPGFDIRHTVRAEVYLPPNVYKNEQTINPYVDRALAGLRALPMVESAAAARVIPFTEATVFGVELTFPDTHEKQHVQFNWNAVTPDFFRAMGTPVLRGRAFGPQDTGEMHVVIVNDVFVRRYLPNREPLGTAFSWREDKVPYRIVGVTKSTKNMTIGEDPRAQLYEPLAQIKNDRSSIQFVIRSATTPAGAVEAVRQALRRAEPAAGLEVQSMFSAIGFAFLPSQIGAVLMGSTGTLGLLLALIGLYGVLAYSVARRTREIGIRMAIGASPGNVARLVLVECGGLLVAGMGTGLLIALLITRPLSLFLVPGLSPSDPASFGTAIIVLGATGLLAALAPVHRALHVDPAECLRYE